MYKKLNPHSNMIQGDITDKNVFKNIIDFAISQKTSFMIASPPCQGISVVGKNRKVQEWALDQRNYLITYVVEAIQEIRPKYILIENVPKFLNLYLKIQDEYLTVLDILEKNFSNDYDIEAKILDTADFGTPQTRKRAIIKMNKKGTNWSWPKSNSHVYTVKDAIGNLPSLEAGEKSAIKWHFARNHTDKQIDWMRHTATGKSAVENDSHYPIKDDGTRIKSYTSSYRRINWDTPAPTITIRNDAISSQRNVHPGRLKEDGTYSDARVLTPLELMRLTGLPDDWGIPDDTPEILIRQVLGECIPPLLVMNIVKGIDNE